MPRAHLDEGGDQFTNRAVLLSSGQEHCQRINFHVLVSRAAPSADPKPLQEGDTELEGEAAVEG